MTETDHRYYLGEELALFEKAYNWKNYWADLVSKYIVGDVVEIGAGMGSTTKYLYERHNPHATWVCIEPDPILVEKLNGVVAEEQWPNCQVIEGTLSSVTLPQQFDTALYIDVLEHIEDDAAEVKRALSVLKPGGYLIALSPAHQWLFSPFDSRIGHFRRYSKESLNRVVPEHLERIALQYVDSAGLFASLANKMLLKRSMPNAKQLQFWNSCLVPISRVSDGVLSYSVGKSVLGVWRKPI